MNGTVFENYLELLCVSVAIWNFAVFMMYGTDKLLSKLQSRRISEKMLIASAFLLGGVGAFCGMQIFRHKTKHLKFVILVPVAAILTFATVVGFGYTILL